MDGPPVTPSRGLPESETCKSRWTVIPYKDRIPSWTQTGFSALSIRAGPSFHAATPPSPRDGTTREPGRGVWDGPSGPGVDEPAGPGLIGGKARPDGAGRRGRGLYPEPAHRPRSPAGSTS